jgi:hypothetical protein
MTTTLANNKVEVLLTKEEIVMLIVAYDSKASKFRRILTELQTDLFIETTCCDDMRKKDLWYMSEISWEKRMKKHNSDVRGHWHVPFLHRYDTKTFRNWFNYKLWLNEQVITQFEEYADKIRELSELQYNAFGIEYDCEYLKKMRLVDDKVRRSKNYFWQQKQAGNTEYNYTHYAHF